jgi:tetratricopeptide (TPR) repeat protein
MALAKRDQILQEAEKLASRGKLDAAIKEYRRAVEQAPNDTNTLNRLGDLLQRASRIPEAVEVYQRIADHFSEDGFFLKAIAIYKKINRLDPQRTETYEKLADLYFKQGLVVEGRQQLLTLADWFTRSKRVPETIRVFRRLADLEPTNLQARAKLVDLLVQSGEVDALAAEIEPLGKALLGRGMLDEAIKLYHRALDLKPKDCTFVAPCIEALAAGGRLVPAKELADLALQAGGPGPELARAAARAYVETGDLKTARSLLDEAISRLGERTELVQLLADVLLRVGDAGEAKERVIPVVDRLVAAGDLVRAGGLIRRLLRSTPGDIDVLQRAREVFDRRDDPEMAATVEAALADAYFRANRRDDAARLYRELARLDPGNRLFAQRLEALGGARAPAPAAPAPAVPPASPAPAPAPAAADSDLEFVDVQVEIEGFESADPQLSSPPPHAGPLPPVEPASAPAAAAAPQAAPPRAVPMLAAVPSFEAPTGDAARFETGGAPEVGAEEPAALGAPESGAQVSNAEELYTEAVVFAKYGLTDKAISHVHRLLALDPTHAGGRALLSSLGEELVEVEPDALAGAAGERPVPSAAVPIAAAGQESPSAEPPPSAHAARGRVKLEELETILGLGAAPQRDAERAVADRRFAMPEITFEVPGPAGPAPQPPAFHLHEIDLSEMLGHEAAPAAARPEALALHAAPGPAAAPEQPAAAPPPARAARAPEAEPAAAIPAAAPPPAGPVPLEADVEVLEEPVELVEVGDVLAGPNDEQLREVDFLIEQGLLDEAAGLLRKLKDAAGDSHDVTARLALLKARGWEDLRPAPAAETSADELFSEEDRFFDLAAELERELADEEIVAEATGANTPGEVSIEELFREFQKGVAEQLREEDYDTHFNLGIAYREMGLLDEAIREFQLAAKSPELGVEATSMIGSCYLEHGLPEQAAEWYARALAMPGVAPEVQIGLRYELGRAHEANGNLDGALASFGEVLALNPGFRDVVDRVARLRAN